MASPSRFAAALPSPVLPDERFHVAPLLDATRAEKRIREEIEGGVFRAPDAAKAASIEEVFALFVPFWRMDVQRTDESLAVSQVHVGTMGIPIPRMRTKESRTTCMVCARTSFPYEMKDPKTLIKGDAKPLDVNLAAIVHGDPEAKGIWEVVDADLTQERARAQSGKSLARSSRPDEVFTASELTVHAAHFVRYPVWFARYRYAGVASPGGDLFHVGVSAVDGVAVTARHPSKLRSAAAKVKGLFGFGFGSAAPETPSDTTAGPPPAEAPKPPGADDLQARFRDHVKRARDKP